MAYNSMVLQGHNRQVKPNDSVDFGLCCEAEELSNAGFLTGSQIRNRHNHDDLVAHFKNFLPIPSSLPAFSPLPHLFFVILGFLRISSCPLQASCEKSTVPVSLHLSTRNEKFSNLLLLL